MEATAPTAKTEATRRIGRVISASMRFPNVILPSIAPILPTPEWIPNAVPLIYGCVLYGCVCVCVCVWCVCVVCVLLLWREGH